MNNVIAYVAPKNKTMAHSMSLNNRISYVVGSPSSDSRHIGNKNIFDGDINNSNLQTVLASRNTQRREEQVILSTIRCQATESLPQAGNDQTTNI